MYESMKAHESLMLQFVKTWLVAHPPTAKEFSTFTSIGCCYPQKPSTAFQLLIDSEVEVPSPQSHPKLSKRFPSPFKASFWILNLATFLYTIFEEEAVHCICTATCTVVMFQECPTRSEGETVTIAWCKSQRGEGISST